MLRLIQTLMIAVTIGPLGLIAGCSSSPFQDDEQQRLLQKTVSDSIDRELSNLPPPEQRQATTQPPGDVEAELSERRAELDAMGPDPPEGAEAFDPADLGPDLTGGAQQLSGMTLQSVIASAVTRNLGVQISRLQPAISEADVVAAEAVFDALFFADASYSSIDEPQVATVIPGFQQIGLDALVQDLWRFDTGVRKRLTSGAIVELSTDVAYSDNQSPGQFDFVPNPSTGAGINLGLTQPLLRGFGSDVNTASIRLARNDERRSVQQLQSDLLDQVAEAEAAYWELARAWHILAIRKWLVEVGMDVRDVLSRRREFDTTLAQYADAVAKVEGRKADVIRAQRNVRAASDRLKLLMNAPDATVGSELVILPLDDMVTTPVSYSLRDAILTAMTNRPEIHQAILAIDDASIREVLADNNRLPQLNLVAEMSFLGLDDSADGAYSRLFDGDYINYFLGLAFEVPVGNRAAEALSRRARLERSASVLGYRLAVQSVIVDVKDALRDVITNYELIQATRSFRVAQAENLRALLAEEETLASLTPEFLNLKFQQQETLALARAEEISALVNFSQSVARLYRSMGTGLAMNSIDVEIVDLADAEDAGDG